MTCIEVMTSGMPVKIQLLKEFPLSTEPSTWVKVDGAEVYGWPEDSSKSGNAVGGTIDCQFRLTDEQKAEANAFVITFQNQFVMAGILQKDIGSPFEADSFIRINWIAQPWEG